MTEVLIKVGFLAAVALNGAIIFTIMDVKGASWMQRRPGPLHVGHCTDLSEIIITKTR